MQPLTFEPFFRPQVWGGRRLTTHLNKALPSEGKFGESWEISGHPLHISCVASGPCAGMSLVELWDHHHKELTGQSVQSIPEFPLLVKYLDCESNLSVQVHPDDTRARALGQPCGKSEAWYVLEADPTARIYAGFKPGVTRTEVERRLDDGTLEACLQVITPKAGDAFYIPAGTVHALGGGLLVAEIQQSSDVTYRLFDWNRVGDDGKPRNLHRQEALDAINWHAAPIQPLTRFGDDLLTCPYFSLKLWNIDRRDQPGLTPQHRHQGHDSDHASGLQVALVVDGSVTASTIPGCEIYNRWLSERALRLTPERTLLLGIVAEREHIDMDDLMECSLPYSRSTILRRLVELSEAGLIDEQSQVPHRYATASLLREAPCYQKALQRGDVILLPAECDPLIWKPASASGATLLVTGLC